MSRQDEIKTLAEWHGDIRIFNNIPQKHYREWNPFEYIQDAWELVENVGEIIIGRKTDESWCVVIPLGDYKLPDTIASTAQEAICRAVLALIGEEGE